MSEGTQSRFDAYEEEFYGEDELEYGDLDYDTWSCSLCDSCFVDPDDHPNAKLDTNECFERRSYWLSPTDVVCASCAIAAGIPSVDEEDNG